MAYTADDLVAIEDAIATGARKVKFSDREMEFHKPEEMMKARTLILEQLSGANPKPAIRMVRMATKNGF